MGITDFEFNIRPELYTEIHEWCETNFGPESMETWKLLANNDVGGWIYFVSAADAMAFKLRWI